LGDRDCAGDQGMPTFPPGAFPAEEVKPPPPEEQWFCLAALLRARDAGRECQRKGGPEMSFKEEKEGRLEGIAAQGQTSIVSYKFV
jgi:hypothetical protein